MLDPIINALNAIWNIFINFLTEVLAWNVELIISCFKLLLNVIRFAFWQSLDFAIGLFSPFLVSVFSSFPNFAIFTSNVLQYLSTLNQLFPVTEFFVCMMFLFTFWLSNFVVKVIKKFIPTIA